MNPRTFAAGSLIAACMALSFGAPAEASAISSAPVPGILCTADDRAVPDPVSETPGRRISEDEAREILERLHARVYLPYEKLESLKCEFVPSFVDLTSDVREHAPSRNEADLLPPDCTVGCIEGWPSVVLLRLDNLSKARKAVFCWEKGRDLIQRMDLRATVMLYDAGGKKMDVHPFVSSVLAVMCSHRLEIGIAMAPWRVDTNARFRRDYVLDTEPGRPSVLYKFSHAAPQGPETEPTPSAGVSWERTSITFEPGPDGMPLSASTAMGHAGETDWQPRCIIEFARLGASDKVAIIKDGVDQLSTEYEWAEVDGAWVVKKAHGIRRGHFSDVPSSWEMVFSNFEVNPEIPTERFDSPKGHSVKLDLSTPDAAIVTVLECLRSGREDLLPYCSEESPNAPTPKQARPSAFGYMFDEFRGLRDALQVTETTHENDAWVYRIGLPRPWDFQYRHFPLKFVPVGSEWRISREIDLYQLTMFD